MLTVKRELLLSRMEVAAKVCPTRTPKDILKWAKLECDGDALTITATDPEIGVVMRDDCKGDAETFLLPAAQTVAVLKAMHSDELTLTVKTDGVWVEGNRESVRLPYMPADEFPEWKHEEKTTTTLYGLSGPVERTDWALDVESTRYALGGFHLKRYPEGLFLEATDSRCLAREPVRSSGVPNDWHGVIEPRGLRLAATPGWRRPCLIWQIIRPVERWGYQVYARLLEGRYPDVTKVIPEKFDAEFEISVGELTRVVRLASTVTDKESRGLDIEVSGGVLSVRSGGADKGNAAIEIPVGTEQKCQTSLDASFLSKMLAALDPLDDVLTWGMSVNTAHLFKVRDWRGVIMPLARDE